MSPHGNTMSLSRHILSLILIILCILHASHASKFFDTRNTSPSLGNSCTTQSSRISCGNSLVCVNNKCQQCDSSDQCHAVFGDQFICKETQKATDKQTRVALCQHKPLFPNVSYQDVSSFILNFIGGGFAASSGLGGGGIFVPLLIGVGGFTTAMAIPLSKAMIFGASIANFIMFFGRKHPLDKRRPLIDYDTVMILEPATLLGTIIGVFLNIVLPEYVTLVMLVVLLTITTLRTAQKGAKAWNAENQQRQMGQDGKKDPLLKGRYSPLSTEDDDIMDNDIETEQVRGTGTSLEEIRAAEAGNDVESQHNDTTTSSTMVSDVNPRRERTRQRLEKYDQRIFPFEKYLVLVICWLIIFGLSFLKGGHGTPSVIGVAVCSWLFWVISFSPFLFIGTIMVMTSLFLISVHHKKTAVGHRFLKGDVHWNIFNTMVYPFLCLLAGVAAGCLGIGGGMLKAPILVELGLLPETIVASSSFMIMFTSSITTAQFTILGRLPFDYGIVFCLGGFVSALVGQIVFEYVVKKFDRPSLLVILMSIVIAVSTILMGSVGTVRLWRDVRDGAYLGFGHPC